VDAEVTSPTEREDKIVLLSRVLLPAGGRDQVISGVNQLNQILRPLGLETSLVMLQRTNSITLYFICLSVSAIKNLRGLWGLELRRIVNSLFAFLSGATHPVYVTRLFWPQTDYDRCLKFFSSSQGKPKYTGWAKSKPGYFSNKFVNC